MKINRNNTDLKSINWNRGSRCLHCQFNFDDTSHYCRLFCRSYKVWIKDIFNSDIFRL
jgi:hypothetical protein